MSFIPYLRDRRECPECKTPIPECDVDDGFLRTCCDSLTSNLESFRSFEPSAWIANSTGDCAIGDAARILDLFIHSWSANLERRLSERPDLLWTLLDDFDAWSDRERSEIDDPCFDTPSWIAYVKGLSRAVLESILPERVESMVQAAAQRLYDLEHVRAAREVLRMFFVKYEASAETWSAAVDTSMDLWYIERWPLTASVTVTDYEAAHERFGEAPEVLGMLADVGFAAHVSDKWEQAVFYYNRALELHEKAIRDFRPTGILDTPTLIYKVDISRDKSSVLRGPSRRLYFGEQTHSDLHAGLARAYSRLGEYDLAIANLHAAADSRPIEVECECKYWSRLSLPYRIGVFRESREDYVDLAGQMRRKKHSPLRFLDRLRH